MLSFELNSNSKLIIKPEVKECYVLIKDSGVIEIEGQTKIIFIHQGALEAKVEINLTKYQSELIARDIALTSNDELFNKEVLINHYFKHTYSHYQFFGIAMHKSFLKVSVTSKIHQDMKGSEAHQMIRIISTDEAKAQGKPSLLVDNFDVKASHGNSIGQLDQDSIYYLQTKGLKALEAKWLLIKAEIDLALINWDKDEVDKILQQIKTQVFP